MELESFFVLKPKSGHKGDLYAKASREAMLTFANLIYPEDQEISKTVRDWANKEEIKDWELKDD